jgi:regulator of ribonuclease activity A
MSPTTADLCDRYEDLLRNHSLRILATALHSYGGRPVFFGQIATVRLFEDNSFVRATLEESGSGRVLVIDGGGSLRRAVLGDQLAELAVRNHWAGIVVNGCIRDSAALASMDIGVLALATHPRKTDKRNIGKLNVSVSFGNVRFEPGEWLYADQDGVLVSTKPLV